MNTSSTPILGSKTTIGGYFDFDNQLIFSRLDFQRLDKRSWNSLGSPLAHAARTLRRTSSTRSGTPRKGFSQLLIVLGKTLRQIRKEFQF